MQVMARPQRPRLLCRLVLLVILAVVSVGFPGFASAAASGSQVWAKRFNGPGDGSDAAYAITASPDGTKVFVAGYSVGSASGFDYTTLAYDASTGARLWIRRYDGAANDYDAALSLVASPTGTTVFVTGESVGAGGDEDYATLAYDASTGARLWIKRYNGPADSVDRPSAIAVSSDGGSVFVTGGSIGEGTFDYATLAYDGSTGATLWAKRYNGPANDGDHANSVAVSPEGTIAFVTGQSWGIDGEIDYATFAYDASTGAKLWLKRYDGPVSPDPTDLRYDIAYSLALSPDGTKVFVTGESPGVGTFLDYATLAYDASTGIKLWGSRYNGPGNYDDVARSVSTSSDGTKVFVTGVSSDESGSGDYGTLAYDASTGTKLWARLYDDPHNLVDSAYAAVASPDGTEVFVTGFGRSLSGGPDYATLAYDASSGAKLWASRYGGPGSGQDAAFSIAVSPDGARVFVTGSSLGSTTGEDYATLAYAA
jgi:hypothetical protein